MIDSLSIFIIKSSLEPWQSSSEKIFNSILAALKGLKLSLLYSVKIYESFNNFTQSKRLNNNEIHVVICHINQSTEQEVLTRRDEYLWVLISGGQHAVSDSFREKMQHCHTIWFQGAYKREKNFFYWIRHWAKEKFDISSFRASEDALFFGASGPTLHMIKLRQYLQPLKIIIDGFDSLLQINEIEIDSHIIEELSKGISEVINNPGMLDMICSEATLLDGWFASQKRLQIKPVELIRDALSPLIPHVYAHSDSYNPKLDIDLIALAENRQSHQKAIKTVKEWQKRLAVLYKTGDDVFQEP